MDMTPSMAAEFRRQFLDGMRMAGLAPLGGLPRSSLAAITEILSQRERDHQAAVRKWERHAPERRKAEEAMARAIARRAAGQGARTGAIPVLAAAWADKPELGQVR